MNDDEFKRIAQDFFEEEKSRLEDFFSILLGVTRYREGREKDPIGFEQYMITMFGNYLILNQKKHQIQDITIGTQFRTGLKPSITFEREKFGRIVVQLKTCHDDGPVCRVKYDIGKNYTGMARVFFLAVGYPGKYEDNKIFENNNPVLFLEESTSRGFQLFCYRYK